MTIQHTVSTWGNGTRNKEQGTEHKNDRKVPFHGSVNYDASNHIDEYVWWVTESARTSWERPESTMCRLSVTLTRPLVLTSRGGYWTHSRRCLVGSRIWSGIILTIMTYILTYHLKKIQQTMGDLPPEGRSSRTISVNERHGFHYHGGVHQFQEFHNGQFQSNRESDTGTTTCVKETGFVRPRYLIPNQTFGEVWVISQTGEECHHNVI